MCKRLLVYLVLTSMILHYAGRLGILDSLYQQRHSIAYNLGLIAEIPIAICNGDYDFDKRLNFHSGDDHQDKIPVNHQPTEITLFICNESLNIVSCVLVFQQSEGTSYNIHHYKSPDLSIFQPPKV
jgi:hypothetical protein